jgi:ABC-type Fe3+ transport system permease subunit
MSEKDLAKALLRDDNPIDLQALTQSVLRRDRRRMWVLGFLCLVAWMLVVMLPWATVLPMLARVVQLRGDLSLNAAQQKENSSLVLEVVREGTISTFICSVASMLVAAICTVSLVILSRRATLRQVNVRLADISSQLKLLTKDSK